MNNAVVARKQPPTIVITPPDTENSVMTEIYIIKKKSDGTKIKDALNEVQNKIRESKSRNNGR